MPTTTTPNTIPVSIDASPHNPALQNTMTTTIDTQSPPKNLLQTEWLITNGTGAFAMGTVAGAATRRYHSLFNASTHPPVGRINTLAGVNETISFDGESYELACHEFTSDSDATIFHPKGYQYLSGFKKSTACQWTYRVGPLKITKTLRLIQGRQLAELTYNLESALGDENNQIPLNEPVTLTIAPLLAMRDFHHLRRQGDQPLANDYKIASTPITPTTLSIESGQSEDAKLLISCNPGSYQSKPDAWTNFHRRIEASRQQDSTEDLLIPGHFTHTYSSISANQPATFTLRFGTEALDDSAFHSSTSRADHLAPHIKHLHNQFDLTPVSRNKTDAAWDAQLHDKLPTLALAADDFVVARQIDDQPMTTILAGYPWFADWGRDTMISLPGLLLNTGRFDEALQTLLAYGRNIKNGLIPNRFDDYGAAPHYNTVDASLWFVHACLEYLRVTNNQAAWEADLSNFCTQIINAYRDGTDNNIHMDRDGLIIAGNENTQLTWMDAQHDGVVFTPRHGKAVEINALWYRALVGCANQLETSNPTVAEAYAKLAKKTKSSFKRIFWNEKQSCLIDHINEQGRDPSIRLNQIFAVSLPESMLTKAQQKAVLQTVHDQLLTPMGLRTLAPDDPEYRSHYTGSMFDRDSAYHRGTAWAWPIGAYVEGHLRAHNFSATSKRHARAALAPLLDELADHSVGQLHEIFDGDAPHSPQGCIAQAWSIAEVLRAAMLIKMGSA